MRSCAYILIALCALTAGCRGYSLDMSGLDTYSSEKTDSTNDKLSMGTLERASTHALNDAAESTSVAAADRAMSAATEKTNDRLSIGNLERLSTKHLEPAGDGLTLSKLDAASSAALDPDKHKIRKD